MQNLELKAGELICFSTGEYSDYGYNGHFVVLQDVKSDEVSTVVKECKEDRKNREANGEYWFGDIHEMFIAQCIKRGWLLSIDCREIHIGSYNNLDLL